MTDGERARAGPRSIRSAAEPCCPATREKAAGEGGLPRNGAGKGGRPKERIAAACKRFCALKRSARFPPRGKDYDVGMAIGSKLKGAPRRGKDCGRKDDAWSGKTGAFGGAFCRNAPEGEPFAASAGGFWKARKPCMERAGRAATRMKREMRALLLPPCGFGRERCAKNTGLTAKKEVGFSDLNLNAAVNRATRRLSAYQGGYGRTRGSANHTRSVP